MSSRSGAGGVQGISAVVCGCITMAVRGRASRPGGGRASEGGRGAEASAEGAESLYVGFAATDAGAVSLDIVCAPAAHVNHTVCTCGVACVEGVGECVFREGRLIFGGVLCFALHLQVVAFHLQSAALLPMAIQPSPSRGSPYVLLALLDEHGSPVDANASR